MSTRRQTPPPILCQQLLRPCSAPPSPLLKEGFCFLERVELLVGVADNFWRTTKFLACLLARKCSSTFTLTCMSEIYRDSVCRCAILNFSLRGFVDSFEVNEKESIILKLLIYVDIFLDCNRNCTV